MEGIWNDNKEEQKSIGSSILEDKTEEIKKRI